MPRIASATNPSLSLVICAVIKLPRSFVAYIPFLILIIYKVVQYRFNIGMSFDTFKADIIVFVFIFVLIFAVVFAFILVFVFVFICISFSIHIAIVLILIVDIKCSFPRLFFY
ncbi:hypothetical protein BDA99DRAFT_520312 [Phascolomyces articulosus]|uniref:Uncharacterized protein n=1 Tax=Phascolomyces articulosus TaxID=60185 RepID=A0AAD5PAP3_9FUNG|nr:hypothetical protein BDA99DRAFT_520312 [Phascolomyces articulosus]